MQTSPDGSQCEIKGATAASYTLSVDEIGCFISVSCEPIRSDWARGPIVLSEQIGPVIPGTQYGVSHTFQVYYLSHVRIVLSGMVFVL